MSVSRGARARSCPICGKPAIERYRPFCSARCADVDLHRWFGEAYALPADAQDRPDPAELPDHRDHDRANEGDAPARPGPQPVQPAEGGGDEASPRGNRLDSGRTKL